MNRMRSFLKPLRGAVGVGLTWGGAWGGIFAVLGLVAWLFDPDSIGPGEGPVVIIGTGALLGLVSGAVFSGLLLLAEGGKELGRLSVPRGSTLCLPKAWGNPGSEDLSRDRRRSGFPELPGTVDQTGAFRQKARGVILRVTIR
jgi:hypothetical protein